LKPQDIDLYRIRRLDVIGYCYDGAVSARLVHFSGRAFSSHSKLFRAKGAKDGRMNKMSAETPLGFDCFIGSGLAKADEANSTAELPRGYQEGGRSSTIIKAVSCVLSREN
jgi:hypothetical protein